MFISLPGPSGGVAKDQAFDWRVSISVDDPLVVELAPTATHVPADGHDTAFNSLVTMPVGLGLVAMLQLAGWALDTTAGPTTVPAADNRTNVTPRVATTLFPMPERPPPCIFMGAPSPSCVRAASCRALYVVRPLPSTKHYQYQ